MARKSFWILNGKTVNHVKSSYRICLNHENTTTHKNILTLFFVFKHIYQDITNVQYSIHYKVYNFISFRHVSSWKHQNDQDYIPTHHPPKVLHPWFPFLILSGNHGHSLFSRNLYKSNHTLCTCFSFVSHNRHNYSELHSCDCMHQ